MTGPQSSQNFVRALKAPNDPPVVGGPLKIALAEQAWKDSSFRVLNKPEVIVDWLLTRFLKEKPSDIKEGAVADVRYWTLLKNIIISSQASTRNNTWLKALLARISIVPIVNSLLASLDVASELEQLASLAASCLAVLWPLGTQKVITEAFLGSWATFLIKSLPFRNNDAPIQKTGVLLAESYRFSLSNSSARKKIHTTFIQNQEHLKAWIEQISVPSNDEQYDRSVLLAGIETLFNVDILRQIQDAKDDEVPLFQSLLSLVKTHRSLVLGVLPQLFTHYIAALRRHKGTLFSGGSSSHSAGGQKPELNAAAMQFFGFCLGILDLEPRDVLAWSSASNLLNVVEHEHLYLSKGEGEGDSLLTRNLDLGLGGLSECWQEERADLTEAVMHCMSALLRIDCDPILPTTPRILSRLLCIPSNRPSHFIFLDLLLDYHIKTRTVNDYIDTLFSVLPLKSFPLPLDAHQRYQLCLSSPLLHPRHLEKLAKAVYQFLTPSQCGKTVQLTFDVLHRVQEQYKAAQKTFDASQGKGSRKKRKSDAGNAMDVDEEGESDAEDPNNVAVTFTLTARVAQVVLGSVPLRSLPQEQAKEVQVSVSTFLTEFVQHHCSKLAKALVKKGEKSDEEASEKNSKRKHKADESEWGSQVVLTSILRLQYALERAKALELSCGSDEKLTKRLVELVGLKGDRQVMPELVMEISRNLLLHGASMDRSEVSGIIEPVLAYVEEQPPYAPGVSWSGEAHRLTQNESGRPQASLALLHLLLERWLPFIDILATPQQLSRLVKIIVRLPLDSSLISKQQQRSAAGGDLLPDHLLLRTLRSAHFWELQNLRTALLAHLMEVTSGIEGAAPEGVLGSTYRLLLFFPVEYFTKPCRAELVRRALNADRLLQPYNTGSKVEASAVLRLFLGRAFTFVGTVEQQSPGEMADFLLHLLQEPASDIGKAYLDSTLDLSSLYFLEVFRQCSKSTSGEIHKVLSSYAQYPLYDGAHTVRAESLIRIVDLTESLQFTNFSADNQTAFRDLHSHLASVLQKKISSILQIDASDGDLEKVPALMSGWHAVLALGAWLGIKDMPQSFGHQLAKKFNPAFVGSLEKVVSSWKDDVAVMTVAIIVRELQYWDAMEQNEQLDLGVAAYLSSLRILSSPGRVRVDGCIGKASRVLSPEAYSHVLDIIAETLTQSHFSQSSLSDLIHLASIFLREHPQNTLKITQGFVTACINAFNGSDIFVDGLVELRLQVLGLLNQHCSERPAALRLLDMGGLWLLLSKFLTPSTHHDPSTSTDTFQKIVSIANALIRLRRDLVVAMLPHLGMVLGQLLSCMRSCRPQLGSKQTKMVMNTQPRWIAAEKALGMEEAKALARLLETLTTKTVPRSHAQTQTQVGGEAQKAESLANAFSKHAAYVLKAYIEAVNEPLCVLSVDVRRELAPGLYALCGMVSEHSRDAVMVSALDAAGKVTMKALWKEYEKQRYVGRG